MEKIHSTTLNVQLKSSQNYTYIDFLIIQGLELHWFVCDEVDLILGEFFLEYLRKVCSMDLTS